MSVFIGICWGIGITVLIGGVIYKIGYERGKRQLPVDELEKMWFQQ